ncbi:hypothetical protein R5H30_10710 [Sulfitobacter sp. D35]|nr:hypothetical protein [Sulfitobacter sp. D35]MDW4498453.1 hypothetical protein [Sulfitobacter sp. D35]
MLRLLKIALTPTRTDPPVAAKPRPEWAKPPREWRYLDPTSKR